MIFYFFLIFYLHPTSYLPTAYGLLTYLLPFRRVFNISHLLIAIRAILMFAFDISVYRANAKGRRDGEIRQFEIFRNFSHQELRTLRRWQTFTDKTV